MGACERIMQEEGTSTNPLVTLDSGIEVGPTFINFAFFSRPYVLIRDYIKII